MRTMSYSESRARYAEVLNSVVDENPRGGRHHPDPGQEDVVMVARDEYESLRRRLPPPQPRERAPPARLDRPSSRTAAVSPTNCSIPTHEARLNDSAWADYLWWQCAGPEGPQAHQRSPR